MRFWPLQYFVKLIIICLSKTQVFHLFVGVTGTVGALAFGFNIFQLKEDSGEAG